MYLRRRRKVKHEGERRSVFLRYLRRSRHRRQRDQRRPTATQLYEQLLEVARRKTAEADVQLDDRGRPVDEEDDARLSASNVLIVEPDSRSAGVNARTPSGSEIRTDGTAGCSDGGCSRDNGQRTKLSRRRPARSSRSRRKPAPDHGEQDSQDARHSA